MLAGLLARHIASGAPANLSERSALAEADRQRRAGTLRAALPDPAAAFDAVDELLLVTAEDYEEERCEPLFDLDDLCAGAIYVGEPQRYAAAVRRAIAAIAESPSLWRETAVWCAELLRIAPPLPSDPMLALWRRVETCGEAKKAEEREDGRAAP